MTRAKDFDFEDAIGGDKKDAKKALDPLEDEDKKCWAKYPKGINSKLKARAPSMAPSAMLRKENSGHLVTMGDEDYLEFSTEKPAIGTHGLCGCTAVVVITQNGAIVAHVSPNTAKAHDQFVNLRNFFNDKIKDKQTITRIVVFSPQGLTGVQAKFQDACKAFTKHIFTTEPEPKTYDRAETEQSGEKWGTVVVVKEGTGAAKLYLNDEEVA